MLNGYLYYILKNNKCNLGKEAIKSMKKFENKKLFKNRFTLTKIFMQFSKIRKNNIRKQSIKYS